ncbi:MAG: glucose-6-phosphate isomerase, partial [Chloroflexota bacterium]
MARSIDLTQLPAWLALAAHYNQMHGAHLRDLFAADPRRGERFTAQACGIYLDYSKNRVEDETIRLLIQLAEERGLAQRREAMFRGEAINATEGRAALHVALRAPRGQAIYVDGQNVVPEVHAVLDRMTAFADAVRGGAWLGHTGKHIRNVVNIG